MKVIFPTFTAILVAYILGALSRARFPFSTHYVSTYVAYKGASRYTEKLAPEQEIKSQQIVPQLSRSGCKFYDNNSATEAR